MSNLRYKGEILMSSPLELNHLIAVIFDLEIEPLFFFDYTISEIDFIFLLKRQIFK